MTKFHLFLQDSVRLETAPTGGVRKSYYLYIFLDAPLRVFEKSRAQLAPTARDLLALSET